MKYHFQNNKGWMSEPCGFVYFKNKYHVFFQHYPYAPRWGQMHWGHAVSTNLIDWTELDIALSPDEAYENENGCFGGSAIVKDGRMYLFYTACSSEMGQTQCMAYSDDGINFTKYDQNPIIKTSPLGENRNFRNPYVFRYGKEYRMLIGAGAYNIAHLLLYKSENLIDWEYVNDLIEDVRFGSCIESPELFQIEDKWVLMFSSIKALPHKVCFAVGEFDGKNFVVDDEEKPYFPLETGPDFYSPKSCLTIDDRRLIIAWMYNWSRKSGNGQQVGALTIPRQLEMDYNDNLTMNPCDECLKYIVSESRFVDYDNGRLRISFEGKTILDKPYAEEPEVMTLEDVGVVELFVNNGKETITSYIC